uniref:Uncharacterized protein n=1 Tax=Setaria digitata TaxID=48799 RepID=A0A915Q5F5_9BILA
MSSRMRHVITNDNPETLAISQFYANYCNPAITAVTTTAATTTTTTTTSTSTTTPTPTTTGAATATVTIITTVTTTTTTTTMSTASTSVIATKVKAQHKNKPSEPSCICSRNRRILAKTWDSALHRLSLPGMASHSEVHFIIPVNHNKSTSKDNTIPDLTQVSSFHS